MKNIITTLLAACLLLMGCGSSETKTTESESTPVVTGSINYDEMAQDFCSCMQPMFDFQERLMGLLEEGKQDEIEALRDDALQVQKDGEACIMALEEQYGIVEGVEEEAKATEALQKACPEIMALMGAAAESFEE